MSAVINAATVVTPRDLELFWALAIARVLDGEQAKIVGGFASIRRTNRRLLKLVRAGLLRRWFVGAAGGGQKALYGLSPNGASLIGETAQGLIPWKPDALVTSSQFLAHQLAVNAVFLVARYQPLPPRLALRQWTRPKLPLSPSVPLVPDAYFEIVHAGAIHPMFLEVDLGTESSKVWQKKVELYLKLALAGEFGRLFSEKRFRTLIVLPSTRRLESIRTTIAKRTEKLFWLTTSDEVRREGLWNAIWLRPVGREKVRIL